MPYNVLDLLLRRQDEIKSAASNRNEMANRSMQRQNMRRFAHRQSGGGFGIVGSLLPIPADNAQFDYHPRVDARVTTDDCAIPDRTGQLHNAANPALAQAGWPLTGGSRRLRRGSRKQRGGAFTESPFIRPSGWPQQGGAYTESPFIHPSGWTLDADTAKAQVVMAGGKRRTQRRKSRKVRKSRKQRGGGCGCSGSKLMYGGGRRRRTQRGGSKGGYAIDPSMSVGGSGPVAEPIRTAVPCDQPLYETSLPSDPRAGAPYSLTPNTTPPTGVAASAAPVQAGGRRRKGRKGRKSAKKQRGGSYSLSAAAPFSGSGNTNSYGNGNGFPASCYAAPGSQLPTYGATTAGFTFTPNTVANGSMTPGVVAYEEVVPVAARM